MKKIILAVILLAAAGGGIYYLLKKKDQIVISDFKQEQILGKWKLDSLTQGKDSASLFVGIMGMVDSSLMKYDYDFRKEGIVVKFLKDSIQKDTTHYEWTKDNHLIWKEQGDSTGQTLAVNKLNQNSLVLRTKDSTLIYFRKVK
jgi:hypothetical protein